MENNEPEVGPVGSDRRTFIKRSAVVGGTLVWAAPVVQTLAKPAFATSSGACEVESRRTIRLANGTFVCRTTTYPADDSCCEGLDNGTGGGDCTPRGPVVTTTVPGRCS